MECVVGEETRFESEMVYEVRDVGHDRRGEHGSVVAAETLSAKAIYSQSEECCSSQLHDVERRAGPGLSWILSSSATT